MAPTANTKSDLQFLRSARGLIALGLLPRVGNKTRMRAAIAGEFESLIKGREAAWASALRAADDQLEQCARRNTVALSFFDERYPERLRWIHDPPAVLFVRGSVDVLHESKSVAVVGTRKPSEFGIRATDDVVAALAEQHWSIVSGLARGIDTLAHGGALKHHTSTVAVMAGGLDTIYPAQNRELAEAMIDSGGCLVSEQMLGRRPFQASFVARNRIQTALSAAVLVMQTGIEGGTTHTVRHAAAQGKPVFCPDPRSSAESNKGLETLLNSPGNELCQTLPSWKHAEDLCRRLGRHPIARPIDREHVAEFMACLQAILCAHEERPSRWWAQTPPNELPSRSPWDAAETDNPFALGAP